MGAQWLSGRVLDSRPKGRRFEPHRRHCVVSLSKNINPSLVLVQPRKTRPFITERLLMGRKESNLNKITSKCMRILHSPSVLDKSANISILFRSGCCQTSGSSEKSDKSLVTDVWQQRKVG